MSFCRQCRFFENLPKYKIAILGSFVRGTRKLFSFERTLLSIVNPLASAKGRSRGSIARARGNCVIIGSWWWSRILSHRAAKKSCTLLQNGINWQERQLRGYDTDVSTNFVLFHNIPDVFPFRLLHLSRMSALSEKFIEDRTVVVTLCGRYISISFRRYAYDVIENGQRHWSDPWCLDEGCIWAEVVVNGGLDEITRQLCAASKQDLRWMKIRN